MKPISDKDFVQAYLDGALSPEQNIALERRLRTEPRLAELLIALSREEAVLIEWVSAQAVDVELVDRNFLRLAKDQSAPHRRGHSRRNRRWVAAALLVASAAAGVVFALLGKFPVTPPSNVPQPGQPAVIAKATKARPEEPVALVKLEDVQGDVYVIPEKGEAFKAQPGQTLTLGERLQTRGDGSYAVVALADSTRLDVNGNTTIQLQNSGLSATSDQGTPSMRVYLEEGTMVADAARKSSDRPMVVATAHAEAPMTDSRATFTSSPKGTRIEHDKGKKIRVTRKSDGRSIDMQTGWVAMAPANAASPFATQQLPKPTTQARLVLKKDKTSVHSVAYSPDGNVLATGAADGTVKFWNMAASGLAMPDLKVGGKAPVRALAYSPSGNLLAVAAEDKLVKLYDPATNKEVAVLRGQRTNINCLAFSRDGALLATGGGGRNGEVRIWNVASRTDLGGLNGHAGAVLALAFADGRTLATASKDGTVKIWDVIARELKHSLAHAGPVNTVAFAPDGAMLASAGKDLTIKLWDTATGAERKTFQGMGGEIRAVAFSPDGATLAAADNSVRLWDVASGQQRWTFLGHKNAIVALAFAPSGKEIATVGWDKTIRIWDVPAAGK